MSSVKPKRDLRFKKKFKKRVKKETFNLRHQENLSSSAKPGWCSSKFGSWIIKIKNNFCVVILRDCTLQISPMRRSMPPRWIWLNDEHRIKSLNLGEQFNITFNLFYKLIATETGSFFYSSWGSRTPQLNKKITISCRK